MSNVSPPLISMVYFLALKYFLRFRFEFSLFSFLNPLNSLFKMLSFKHTIQYTQSQLVVFSSSNVSTIPFCLFSKEMRNDWGIERKASICLSTSIHMHTCTHAHIQYPLYGMQLQNNKISIAFYFKIKLIFNWNVILNSQPSLPIHSIVYLLRKKYTGVCCNSNVIMLKAYNNLLLYKLRYNYAIFLHSTNGNVVPYIIIYWNLNKGPIVIIII